MGEFITGVKDKYPAALLKGRVETEGNVISCFFKDLMIHTWSVLILRLLMVHSILDYYRNYDLKVFTAWMK